MKSSNESVMLIVALYVDDLLITELDIEYLKKFKAQKMFAFEMTDLSLMSYFLGIEGQQNFGQISLHQSKYAKDLLKKFNMSACKLVLTPLIVSCNLSKNDD